MRSKAQGHRWSEWEAGQIPLWVKYLVHLHRRETILRISKEYQQWEEFIKGKRLLIKGRLLCKLASCDLTASDLLNVPENTALVKFYFELVLESKGYIANRTQWHSNGYGQVPYSNEFKVPCGNVSLCFLAWLIVTISVHDCHNLLCGYWGSCTQYKYLSIFYPTLLILLS